MKAELEFEEASRKVVEARRALGDLRSLKSVRKGDLSLQDEIADAVGRLERAQRALKEKNDELQKCQEENEAAVALP
jgi:hypothetical protein